MGLIAQEVGCLSFSARAYLCRVQVRACEIRALDLEHFILVFCSVIDFCRYFMQFDLVKKIHLDASLLGF